MQERFTTAGPLFQTLESVDLGGGKQAVTGKVINYALAVILM